MAEAAPNPNAFPADPAGEDFSMSVPESWRKMAVVVPPATPDHRIALIEDSQRCLTSGWLSLLPLIGALFVIPAVRQFLRVDRERVEWNPAAHLWLRGLVLASFGCWTNLLWWGLIIAGSTDTDEEGKVVVLLYLLIFGSAPTLLGLGYAASRWSPRLGAFAQRTRVGLLSMMGAAYIALFWHFWMIAAERSRARSGIHGSTELSFQTQIAVWILWLIGGFICLAWRGVKSWWWLAWLAGAALLTFWVSCG
ncbi:MAG: hypothetical protein RL514_169 [Verrucomicrobiota bacterium]|jgi:hypothetical protein